MSEDQEKSPWRPKGFTVYSDTGEGQNIDVWIYDDGQIRLGQKATNFVTLSHKDLLAIVDIVKTVNDFA